MSTTTQTRRCAGTNKAGEACRNTAVLEDGFCVAHTTNPAETRRLVPGRQPGAGRPRMPRVSELVRAELEDHAHEIAAVYLEAMKAVRPDGEPDYAIRLKAIADWQDRALGKPHQSTSLTGADGGPVSIAQVWAGAADGSISLN